MGLKIRIQKSVVFLNVHNKPFEENIGTASSTVTLKRVGYLEIKLNAKNLHTGNGKLPVKDITENVSRRKAVLCPWVLKLNVVEIFHATQSDLHIERNSCRFSNDTFTKWKMS